MVISNRCWTFNETVLVHWTYSSCHCWSSDPFLRSFSLSKGEQHSLFYIWGVSSPTDASRRFQSVFLVQNSLVVLLQQEDAMREFCTRLFQGVLGQIWTSLSLSGHRFCLTFKVISSQPALIHCVGGVVLFLVWQSWKMQFSVQWIQSEAITIIVFS